MRRREFIAVLGATTIALPLAARAQQPAMPMIGFLNGGTRAEWAHLATAFNQGLNESGYFDGKNVAHPLRSWPCW
jgi:hypothetical protein